MVDIDASLYITSKSKLQRFKKHLLALLPIFSLLVIIGIFWWLKLTGITMAGDAFCGNDEHRHEKGCYLTCSTEHEHTEECYSETAICEIKEHIHTAECYSDIKADLETEEIWKKTFENVTEDSKGRRIAQIAISQLGYKESEINFSVGSDGIKRGYNRYGEWFGNPYGDWSNMFTSFCLSYGGVDVPISSGAEAMRMQWETAGIYQTFGKYFPSEGDVVFLDKNGNKTAEATGIIVEVSPERITVVEGDVNNAVCETTYSLTNMRDDIILGYGLSSPKNSLTIIFSEDFEEDTVGASSTIAKTVSYNQSLFTSTNNFVLYTQNGSNYYAFDGNGNAILIYIDSNGNITTNAENPDTLLWTFSSSGSSNSYYIQNVSTGKYMHAYPNNGSGVITSGKYPSTLIQSGSGVKIKSNSEYAMLNASTGKYVMTQNQSIAATYSFGMTSRCTVWLDGTNGRLMSLSGSLDKSYSVSVGDILKLPEEWQTPQKYSYKLNGWYDITNGKYYAPGAEVTVTGNTVFYADWIAATYDIGKYNASVSNTVSTNDFITTRVFDYGSLFNVMSSNASVSSSSSGHSESWNLLTNGNTMYGNPALNFIFRDWDSYGSSISYPNNTNDKNTNGGVYSGIYTDELANLLFNHETSFNPQTQTGVIGKTYIGTGDHLFQVMEDKNDQHYGYYYYDSTMNAASYNQTDGRFYVYDYLERTTDSAKGSDDKKYSDFLPFNSPYANTNDKNIRTYTYNGVNGEYSGVNHFTYDAKYNTEDNAVTNVGTNYLFGMSIDIDFYLPDAPGSRDSEGNYGNLDLYGKNMHFKFSGDDDVWVLLDGKLVLDIGGIHGVESGDINFSTGVVTVNGVQTGTLNGFDEGEHTLTFYYLERGSSQSNCAIYFNLAPRFSFSIQKEDVLTQDVLNGAEFSVYTDLACTIPAELWESKEAHDNNEPPQNTFTVENGIAKMWGMSAGKTYYIKETAPPHTEGYGCASGIICLSLDKRGIASYSVEIVEDGNDAVSNGFTVHGFKIDEETQQAYIIATNAPLWVEETTSVQVMKKWNDRIDHTGDFVTVYLTVTDPDGTVRRIREIDLSDENEWQYTWTSLPKFYADGETEVIYGIEEAYKSGYYAHVEKVEEIVISEEAWAESYTFENGKAYLLRTSNGYLSTVSSSSGSFMWVSEAEAKASPLALWTATVSGNNVKLTNAVGQILTCQYNGNSTYFYATYNNANYQALAFASSSSGFSLSYSGRYFAGLNSNGTGSHTQYSPGALYFRPVVKTSEEIRVQVKDNAFEVTNTPLETETSLKVTKLWDTGMGSKDLYEKLQATVKLIANGKDTGRTITLSIKNNWSETFLGLPYTDENGNIIVYTIEESWETDDWLPSYGEVTVIPGNPNKYETTLTNVYRFGRGYLLPETGGCGAEPFIYGGISLMAIAIIFGFVSRVKKKKA